MEIILLVVWLLQDDKEISLLWIFTPPLIIFIRLLHYFLIQEGILKK